MGWLLVAALALVLLAGWCASAETALLRVSRAGAKELGRSPGEDGGPLAVVLGEISRYLSVLVLLRVAAEIERRSHFILGSVTMDSPRQVFPLSGMTARAFAANRVMLVGEAAHLFPPIGAQGLNLGYRDVVALGETLDEHRNDPGSAESTAAYDRARRGDVLSRTAAVDALNRTLLSDFLPVQALRGLGLFLIDRVPMLRQMAMRQGIAAR